MEDDWGWCDDTSTTVVMYILRKAKWIEEVFFLFHLSSLNACFKVFSFRFFLPFYFLSHCALTFCIFIFPSYLLPVPVLSLLTASLQSQLFSPLILSFILSVSFYFFWRFCEPQCVNLFFWRNQNVRFVTSWQVTSLSNNYLTSYTSRPRQDPSTASNWTLFARTLSNKRSTLAATVRPWFPFVMALNSDSTRQAMYV
jgi:hypothetical protein